MTTKINPRWLKEHWHWLSLIVCLLLSALLIWSTAQEEKRLNSLPRTVHDQLIGTVTQVSGCNSGKHRLDCWVRFSGGQLIRTDVTEWPGSNVQVGQVVYFRTITQGNERQKFYYVVVGQKYMRYHSSCDDPRDECWRRTE